MEAGTIARSYADALLDVAAREGAEESFAEAFEELAGVLEDDARIRAFLAAPTIDREEKKRVLTTALEGRVPRLFLNFVLVVVDKRRQRLLTLMAREYRSLLDRRTGRVHAEVVLAREADERLEEDIATGLSQRLGKKVVPHIKVDPKILGGIIVRYEDKVLDASLRRKLLGLRRRMMAADLPTEA